jgi:hypothetical protein
VYALNQTHSPENGIFWVTADRFDLTSRPSVRSRCGRADREPPGSQTASSWTTIVEQSWRAEKLLGDGNPSMMGQRERRLSNGDSAAGREPV